MLASDVVWVRRTRGRKGESKTVVGLGEEGEGKERREQNGCFQLLRGVRHLLIVATATTSKLSRKLQDAVVGLGWR